MKTRALITLALVLTALAPVSHAIEFRLLSWGGTIDDLKYADGGTIVSLVAWETALSRPYTFTGTGSLVLFRETLVGGKTVRMPVARLTPPKDISDAILLLAPADSARQTYTALWIDNSSKIRKAQTITYENLSTHSVAVKLGSEEMALSPKDIVTRRTDPSLQRLPLIIAAKTGTDWEVVASTAQPIRPGLRTLVILRDGRPQANGEKALVDILSFNDLPPAIDQS